MPASLSNFDTFQFRHMHPAVFLGTASDRYAGWTDQVYSRDRYAGRITRRTKKVGGKTFVEEVLPVDSVTEYFQHFPILELDFTFYGLLLDKDGKPTQTFHLLHNYHQHLTGQDRIILKAPQIICARKLRRGKATIQNDRYLDPEIFTRQFYEPAKELLDSCLGGIIFEQEYQRKADRIPPEKFAAEFDTFFGSVPKDTRYHVELRTEAFLSDPVFGLYKKHGLGQVLSNWTWLPSLSRQFSLSGRRILNAGKTCIIRLMTPLGARYADAYARAHPFNALVGGMLNEQQLKKTAEIMHETTKLGNQVNVIVNNRYGGNAPLTAQRLAKQFIAIMSGASS